MAYTVITTRPNATDKLYAVTIYGSAPGGAHNALNDDDDAGPYTGGQRDNAYGIFRFPAPAGIPADSSTASRRVRRARIGARLIRGAIENESMLFNLRDGVAGWGNKQQTIRTSTGVWATSYTGWESIAPGGHSWAYWFARRPQVQALWKASGSGNVLRMTALYLDWEIDDQPTVTNLAVAGNTITNHPTVSWDFDDPNGDLQVRYRVRVFSDAQYGTTGFDPATSPSTWDSGEVASAADSVEVGAALVANATYRGYVAAAQAWTGTPEGSIWWSPWAATGSFTIQGTPPPTPTLTAAAVPDVPGYRAAYTVDAPVNLLDFADAGFDVVGSVGRWVKVATGGNPTLAQTAAKLLSGVGSMSLTSAGTGDATAVISGTGDPVLGGRTYTAVASYKAGGTGRSSRVDIRWYNAGGGLISTTTGTGATSNTSSWTQVTASAAAPLNARTAVVALTVASTASSEVHYVDQVQLAAGASTTWTPGGYRDTQNVIVERGDAVDPARGPAGNWVQEQIGSGGSTLRNTDGFLVSIGSADVLTHEPVLASLPGGPDGCVHWAQRSGPSGTIGGGFNAGFGAGLGAGSGGAAGALLLGATPHTASASGYVWPVAPGRSHTIAAALWRGSTAVSVQLYVEWLADDGTTVVGAGGAGTTLALTGSPVRYATTATPPSGARFARGVVLNAAGSSTTDVYVTQVEYGLTGVLTAGAPPAGQPIEWVQVRSLSGTDTPPVGETAVGNDWELPPARPVVYRAKTTAVASDGSTIASAASNYVPVYADPPARNVLLDPFSPGSGVVVNIDPSVSETRTRQAQILYPLGRSADSLTVADPIVVRDWLGSQDLSLTLSTLDEAGLWRLRRILASPRPLLLLRYEGGLTYLMLHEDEGTARVGAAVNRVTVAALEVARPS